MRQHTGDYLGISELTAGYGDAQVLQGVNLRVPVGSSFAVLGRNGVGKSTLLNAILGFVTVASGQIVWKGSEVHALGARETNRLGIALVPQGRRIFPSLTVEENLRVAIRRKAPSKWALDDVYALFPRLGERQKQSGGTLSGGEQQMLAIGRALMTSPDLLLLDEPTEGLAPIIIEDLVKAFLELAGSGVTILLAEQRVAFALQLCDTVAHMGSRGHIEFVGNGDEYRERYGTAA